MGKSGRCRWGAQCCQALREGARSTCVGGAAMRGEPEKGWVCHEGGGAGCMRRRPSEPKPKLVEGHSCGAGSHGHGRARHAGNGGAGGGARRSVWHRRHVLQDCAHVHVVQLALGHRAPLVLQNRGCDRPRLVAGGFELKGGCSKGGGGGGADMRRRLASRARDEHSVRARQGRQAPRTPQQLARCTCA